MEDTHVELDLVREAVRAELGAQLPMIQSRLNEMAGYLSELSRKVNRWEPLVEELATRSPARFKRFWRDPNAQS